MMDKSFGLILAVIALIAGVMLLTGHGDILLKGGNAKLRKEKYDEKKILGRAFDFSRDCFGYQSPGFEIQRAARFLAGCRNVVLRGWTD